MAIESCRTCQFFDGRTGFCRFAPPQSVVYSKNGKTCTESKFPNIAKPDLDYCYKWKEKNFNEDCGGTLLEEETF
jgi:hypothetical protein